MNPIILIDGSWFCFFRYGATTVWYSKHKKIGEKTECNIDCEKFMTYYKDQFNSCLAKICKKFKTNEVYWFADTKQSELWRRQNSEGYKATRESPNEIGPIINWSYKNLTGPTIKYEKTEADDGIAMAVRYERQLNPQKSIYIISGDSDLLQLCDKYCQIICPKGNPTLKPMPILLKLSAKEKIEITPEVYLKTKIILGDKTDEIQPISKAITTKFAHQLATNWELFESHILGNPILLANYQKNEQLIDLEKLPIELRQGLENIFTEIKKST